MRDNISTANKYCQEYIKIEFNRIFPKNIKRNSSKNPPQVNYVYYYNITDNKTVKYPVETSGRLS